jgi:hypothetical protein
VKRIDTDADPDSDSEPVEGRRLELDCAEVPEQPVGLRSSERPNPVRSCVEGGERPVCRRLRAAGGPVRRRLRAAGGPVRRRLRAAGGPVRRRLRAAGGTRRKDADRRSSCSVSELGLHMRCAKTGRARLLPSRATAPIHNDCDAASRTSSKFVDCDQWGSDEHHGFVLIGSSVAASFVGGLERRGMRRRFRDALR